MSLAAPKRSHHAKPLVGDAAREKIKNTSIKDFFTAPPQVVKPGRPAGLPLKKRGRRLRDDSAFDEESASESDPSDLDEDERAQLCALRELNSGDGE